MLFAVDSSFAALDIKSRSLRAGVMYASYAANIYHAVLSMHLAVRRRLVAFEIKNSILLAVGIGTRPHLNDYYVGREMPRGSSPGAGDYTKKVWARLYTPEVKGNSRQHYM